MKQIGRFNILTAILLMADAAEGALDPLDTNVSDIDTSYPLIPTKTIHDMKIAKATKEPAKDKPGRPASENIVIKLETTSPLKSVKGDDIAVGHTLTHYIGITELPERVEDGKTKRAYTLQDIAKSIASIAKPAGVQATPRDIMNNPSLLEGKIVRTELTVSTDKSGTYPDSNRVKEFIVMK